MQKPDILTPLSTIGEKVSTSHEISSDGPNANLKFLELVDKVDILPNFLLS